MVVEERLPNYHLNHVTPLDSNAVIAFLRVVVTTLLDHVREMVERGQCMRVTGLALVAGVLLVSCHFSLGTPPTSSVWTASNKVAKE